MERGDVKFGVEGSAVIRFYAKDMWHAYKAYSYSNDNPPEGYIVRGCRISRRKKGGKMRYLHLYYEHTGNEDHPPINQWEEWETLLHPEESIARGDEAAPRPMSHAPRQ